MEARLLDSLHHKLDDLEGKICAYRGDLITDFQRHYYDLLRDVNPGVASSIERAIVTSFANYPTLRPELNAVDSRPTHDNPELPAFQQSLTPVAVSSRIEAPETSRERESELQGLFTPSYLPLLDSSPPDIRPAISVATTTAPQTTTIPFPLLPETGHSSVGTGTDAGNGMVMDGHTEPGGAPPAASQAAAELGSLARTTTDDSTSSVCSDKSDTKVRRSALRRSSSLSKPPQSPRRVRFEFMGAEVLPTASPQPAEFIAPSASSPYPEDESVSSDTILGDDIEEFEPPPRKSSSTEALRALSRAPMDEGTVWTVVNPDADDAALQQEHMNTPLAKPSSTEKIAPSTVDLERSAETVGGSRTQYSSLGGAPDELGEDHDVDNSSDEEDFLAMGKSKSATRKYVSTPVPQSPNKETTNGYSTTTPPPTNNGSEEGKDPLVSDEDEGVDEYDDDMFHFEPGGLSAPPKPRQRPPPPIPDEPSDDESPPVSSPKTQSKPTLYATSPAVSITRPLRAEPPTPTMSRFQPGSLGSYKGRPVIMPVVKDPEVHARAASLGQFTTFVGGLDGRSGMDEGDLSSFRASVVQSTGFSGTPRSFTERYMMEEAQAEREKNQGTTQ